MPSEYFKQYFDNLFQMKSRDILIIVVILYIFTQFMWMYSMIIQRNHDRTHHMTKGGIPMEDYDVMDSQGRPKLQNISAEVSQKEQTPPVKTMGDPTPKELIVENEGYNKNDNRPLEGEKAMNDNLQPQDDDPAILAVRKIVKRLLPNHNT